MEVMGGVCASTHASAVLRALGKQAHQRWGYFGGLQHFLPPAGVNGLGVNGTEVCYHYAVAPAAVLLQMEVCYHYFVAPAAFLLQTKACYYYTVSTAAFLLQTGVCYHCAVRTAAVQVQTEVCHNDAVAPAAFLLQMEVCYRYVVAPAVFLQETKACYHYAVPSAAFLLQTKACYYYTVPTAAFLLQTEVCYHNIVAPAAFLLQIEAYYHHTVDPPAFLLQTKVCYHFVVSPAAFLLQTEAEAVQAIVNPDAEKVTSASAKRPESLSNDNCCNRLLIGAWCPSQQSGLLTEGTVDDCAEAQKSDTVQPEAGRVPRAHGDLQAAICSPLHPGMFSGTVGLAYATLAILLVYSPCNAWTCNSISKTVDDQSVRARSWRAWKYSRTMDASDELNMIRTEIARRKKVRLQTPYFFVFIESDTHHSARHLYRRKKPE
eukprot:scaffold2160_cov19-Tisochrysis_lutea.AAC.1